MNATASPPAPDYHLRSDLAAYCLPAARRDDARKLAWANSIGLLFLVAAAINLRQPDHRLPEPVPPPARPLEVLLPPPPQTEPPPESLPKEEIPADLPDLLTHLPVVEPIPVAAPESVPFGVDIGPVPVIEYKDVRAVPPPPAILPPPPPPEAPAVPMFRNIRMGGREFRRQPPPPYDEFARARIAGTIEALITVDTNGIPSRVEVGKSSGNASLDRHVTEFIRREWRAEPGDVARYRIAITFVP